MKIALHILILGVMAHLMGLFFPLQIFWVLLVIYGSIWNLKGVWPFMVGFISVFLVWTLYAYGLDYYNGSILSVRVGNLLHLPFWMVPLVTGLLGGLLGGSSTWLGNNLRRLFTH